MDSNARRIDKHGTRCAGGLRFAVQLHTPEISDHHALTYLPGCTATWSDVTTRSHVVGTEIQAGGQTALYAYCSIAHADRAVTTDVDGTPIGFGVPGSTTANEQIAETTAGITHTFFRDPKVGGMQFMAQYSHVRRTPFSVPDGTPTDAAVNMLYFNVRYFLL